MWWWFEKINNYDIILIIVMGCILTNDIAVETVDANIKETEVNVLETHKQHRKYVTIIVTEVPRALIGYGGLLG